jgi:hypothetical protein
MKVRVQSRPRLAQPSFYAKNPQVLCLTLLANALTLSRNAALTVRAQLVVCCCGELKGFNMFRVLPLLLMIGLIALAPLAVPAQDKDKDKDNKVVDEKKADEPKKVDEPVKAEIPPAPKGEVRTAVVEVVPGRWDYALTLVPVISLLLIAILFVLVLSLRSSVNQLEERIKGGS